MDDEHGHQGDSAGLPSLFVVRADDIRRSSGVTGQFFPQVEMEYARVMDRWAVGRPGDVFVVWPCATCSWLSVDRNACVRSAADPIDCCSEDPSQATSRRHELDLASGHLLDWGHKDWNETWEEFSASYREAYETCRAEQRAEIRISMILLAQHCLERWASRVAYTLGMPQDSWFRDAQSHGLLMCGDNDEMLGLAIDFKSDPRRIGLTWTDVTGDYDEPHPLPDFRTALMVASELLVAASIEEGRDDGRE